VIVTMDSDNEPHTAPRFVRTPWDGVLPGRSAHTVVAAGDPITSQDDGTAIALIQTGLARVFVHTTPGRQVTIGYAKPGDVISLAPPHGRRRYEVAAVWHTTLSVLILDEVRADPAIDGEPLLQVELRLASWAYDAAVRLAADTSYPMSARVAQHLRALAVRAPDGRPVVQVSQQRLADFVGTAREVITRQLRALREESVIETQPGRVIVVNEERLATISAGGGHLA
jgi:CRP/FNR family transcriptional regulator, cyclic AMP receptor protein